MSEDMLGNWPNRRDQDYRSDEIPDFDEDRAGEPPTQPYADPLQATRPRWLTAAEVAGAPADVDPTPPDVDPIASGVDPIGAYQPLGDHYLAAHMPPVDEQPTADAMDLPATEPLIPPVAQPPMPPTAQPLVPPAPEPPMSPPVPPLPPMGAPITGADGSPLPPPVIGEGAPQVPVAPPSPPMAYPEGVVDLTGDNAMPAMWDQPVVPSPVVQEPTVDSYESSFETSSAVIIDEEEERRRSRARALGEVDRGADVVIAPVAYEPPTMYQPWPSFVLILLRFLVAAILAIHATQQVLNLAGTTALWENSLLPGGEVWTITMIIVQYLAAVLLVLGLGVRGVGIGIMVAFIIVLCFLQWGAEPFFVDKVSGFRGEVEVFLVMAGLMFVGLGGGSIGVDGAIHRARLERKNTTISQEV